MKKYDSFESYVQNQYYNEIYEEIERFVSDNLHALDIPDASSSDEIAIDDLIVRGISFKSGEGATLEFTASILATLYTTEKRKYDYEDIQYDRWFSLDFSGVLDNGLHNVSINDVRTYSKAKFDVENSLSRFLVPYLYEKNLDAEADKFLEKYYPEALRDTIPIDVKKLLTNMSLEMKYAPLPDNIFGMSIFADSEYEVCEALGKNKHTEIVKSGTILVNPFVWFMRNVGSENNTVVHECIHWDRHKPFFELQKLLNEDLHAIKCGTVETYDKNTEGIDNALMWMEWQANALAPRVLMPARSAKAKITEVVLRLRKQYPQYRNAVILEFAIMEVADFFGVSLHAAKLRAIDLGFDEAEGINVYVDGKKQVPFSFKRGTLQKNQTFIIDRNNAAFEANFNPEFAALAHSDAVVHANSMYCLNDPKYVTKDKNGSYTLTDYALEHVDECCFVFTRDTRLSQKYDDSFYRRCYLCRDIDSSHLVETKYDPDLEINQDRKKRAEEIQKSKEAMLNLSKVMSELPGGFHKTLDYHMKRKGITNEQLAERSLLSARLISSLRNSSDDNIELGTVLAICIGMNLQRHYCFDLLGKAGFELKNTPEHLLYRELLEEHTDETIHIWNETIEEYGYDQFLPSNKHKGK